MAVRSSDLPVLVKAQAEQFIERNILIDCGRVPPNCLKAFLVSTVKRMGLHHMIPYVKGLFRSEVGYEGYYLDAGNLYHVDTLDNRR